MLAATTSPGARFLIITACFVVVAAGMKAAAPILVPLLLALFVALISAPPLYWLQQTRMPRGSALPVVIIGVAGLGFVLSVLISSSIADFRASLPEYQDNMRAQLAALNQGLGQLGLDVPENFLAKTIDPGTLVTLTTNALLGISAMITNLVFILLMAVLILAEASSFPEKIRRAAGGSENSVEHLDELMEKVKRYIFLKTVVSLGTGVFVAVWLALLGVDQYVLWGLLSFLLNYVPNIGSIIAAVPAVLLALLQGGLDLALWATLGFVLVNTIVGNVVEPRVIGQGLGLSPLVVFLSLVFWGWILGPVGMLLSVPLTMIVKIGLETHDNTRWISALLGSMNE